jgi:hypothetical protein
MLSHLAMSGLVLINWPEGVMLPGKEQPSHIMCKGISDLTLAECTKLLTTLSNTGDSRLCIQSVPQLKGM